MAQRDKVKELVGRGLNSYHTKALQQMDRIEKKNKEQNHKISILSNELDNDYLTKTEEGSVVSLEHSKEGMVYLDELQGNTLVNYCSDGSKEMTLNGDIDVEGVSVTTTEGVDNGKIDVLCEGNTLVNLSVTKEKLNQTNPHYSDVYLCETERIKPNTTYTLSYDFECNINFPIERCYLGYGSGKSSMRVESGVKFNPIIGRNKLVFTISSSELERVKADGDIYFFVRVHIDSDKREKTFSTKNVMLLEGDWSNKEIPTHFEGMKSVGEIEGNKIEILSDNGNLYKRLENSYYRVYGSTVTIIEENENGFIYKAEGWDMGLSYLISTEGLFKNKKYVLSWEKTDGVPTPPILHTDYGIQLLNSKKEFKESIPYNEESSLNYIFTMPNSFERGDILVIRFKNSALNVENGACNICINEIGVAKNTVISKLNKKEISLNEPLMSLPNGVKDRIVKISNKYFIERNCGYIFLDNTRNWNYNTSHANPIFECSIKDKVTLNADITGDKLLCDKLHSKAIYSTNENYGICFVNGSVCRIRIDGYTTSEEYVNWINNNPLNVIYQLPTPIYEPLEIEPVLNTYNDVTHISNNSIIPCNMKIKNTGYNAIIKPSTLYTVALDTNKAGTIGMNLGGAKGTTTNNVLTLTTPATLTDDSLRLYGKGINGSKVRLLEGDKTNWIPSFFEGMKSSFEDKLQDDGTYKMEILSNNKNLFDGKFEQGFISSRTGLLVKSDDSYSSVNFINVKNINKITISYTSVDIRPTIGVARYDENYNFINFFQSGVLSQRKQTVDVSNCHYIKFRLYQQVTDISKIISCQVEKGSVETNYVQHLSNKIQFSSIEPLRGLANGVRDRLCIKDNKLMIERNCGKVVLDGDTTKASYSGGIQSNKKYYNIIIKINNDKSAMKSFDEKYKCIAIDKMPYLLHAYLNVQGFGMNQYVDPSATFVGCIPASILGDRSMAQYFKDNPTTIIYNLAEPTYEEVPFELQKIILEGYENGTLFFDTNIPPTSTVTYAGETPIVKATKLNKTEVLNNTEDINDNIIPYLMDMDYRVVMLQLATEELEGGVSMARLFGGTYEMIKRDILSKRLTREEYGYRLADYFNAGKLTEEQVRELEELR